MRYTFSELIDVARVQRLTDLFYSATGIPASVIDLDGSILTGSGWQEVCTCFHRANAETRKRCIESDTSIVNQINAGEKYIVYKCQNGLIDAATPITVQGEHVASFFTGQFLFQPPDRAFFRKQAKQFAFNESTYMEAVEKIPVMEEAKLAPFLDYFSEFAEMLGEMGLRQARQMEAEEGLRRGHDELEQRVQERTAELKRQADLLDLTHDAIIVRNAEGVITFWNRGAEETYGWSREEALGKTVDTLLRTQFPDGLDTVMSELNARGRWEGELLNTRKDGTLITVASRWVLQRDKAGAPADVMEINSDITERKRMEQQLRQSQKMDALGTLTGGIAHDFNNILAAIIGFTEVVKGRLDKESRDARHLDRVLQAGVRGRELIKQLLMFSRKTGEEKKPLQLSSIVKESMKLLRASIPTTISIKVRVEGEPGAILGDPTQIQQVLMNLCANAAFAMGEKGGILDVQLSELTISGSDGNHLPMKPGPYLKLVVSDTGVGIAPEIMGKIFDPFFTTKGQGRGTGLGLSVVHGIVNHHEGHITVESEPGKGTIFTLYFPALKHERSAQGGVDDLAPKGRERVLLVDDEAILTEMGRDLLEDLGYRVTARTNSVEALQLFEDDPNAFDLVLTDQTMPDMTGLELARRILATRRDMPIILTTGFNHLLDSGQAKAAGVKELAHKPLRKGEIARLIRRVLDQQTGPEKEDRENGYQS